VKYSRSISTAYREAVSRELNNLIKNKLIMRKGHDLHVLDILKLTEMVNVVRGSL
jgi:hypothetical protein